MKKRKFVLVLNDSSTVRYYVNKTIILKWLKEQFSSTHHRCIEYKYVHHQNNPPDPMSYVDNLPGCSHFHHKSHHPRNILEKIIMGSEADSDDSIQLISFSASCPKETQFLIPNYIGFEVKQPTKTSCTFLQFIHQIHYPNISQAEIKMS